MAFGVTDVRHKDSQFLDRALHRKTPDTRGSNIPTTDGGLVLRASVSESIDIDVEIHSQEIRIFLKGPSDKYISASFGSEAMVIGSPWTIVMDGNGDLTEWILGGHSAGEKLDANECSILQNIVEDGSRTAVFSCPVQSQYYSFPTVPGPLEWMDAVGFTGQYAMHKHRFGGTMNFAMGPAAPTLPPSPQTTQPPTPAPVCLADLGAVAAQEGVELAEAHGLSLNQCKDRCVANAQCQSFAWSSDSRSCYLKDKQITRTTPNKGTNMGFKTYFFEPCGETGSPNNAEQVCFVSLGAVAAAEGGSVGDFSGQSLGGCIQQCRSTSSCKSFAFSNSNGGACHLKDKEVDQGTAKKKVNGYATYYMQAVSGECPTVTDSPSSGPFRHAKSFSSLRPAYDFIVIGGGGAGCAAAWSLAHNNPSRSVLLIEAGPREPLDFNEGFAQASRNHDIYNHNGWRISNLLGGGTVRNGRWFRGIPLWYTRDFMDLGSEAAVLAFEESALWAADRFAFPRVWPNMQRDVLKHTMNNVQGLRVPSADPADFAEKAGYHAMSFRNTHGLASATDVPGYVYYALYAKLEDGRRTSGQRLVEEYHGKNLDIVVDTMVNRIMWGDAGRAIGLQTSRGDIAVGDQVILACNVYETPSLLQRSGVGPSAVLNKLNVNPAPFRSAVHEDVGKGYWNNIYVSRYFNSIFNFDVRFGQDMAGEDRMHTFARRKMFGIEARIRGDFDLPGGWLDVECSSDMPRGSVEASGNDLRPDGTWPHDVDRDGFIRVCADCIQAFFLDSYWPMFKAFRGDNYGWAVDSFYKQDGGLRNAIKAAGPPSPGNHGPRWADNGDLAWQLKQKWQEALGGDVDSVHYGGSCQGCIDKQSFLLHGSSNVRIADLSVFSQPLPGNTMAAAYTIGNYVAKLISGGQQSTLQTKSSFQDLLDYRKMDLTYFKFEDDLRNHGYQSLYKMDGSNLEEDWLYNMVQDHEYYHNPRENGVCGITFANNVNQFLISKGAYYNFALKFYVKIEKGINSGMQVRSYVEPGQSTGAQVFGPQLEIDDDDVGLFYHEGCCVKSEKDPAMVAAWNRDGWNVYEAVIHDNRYYWRINGAEKEITFDFDAKTHLQIHNRIGLQIHYPGADSEVGGEACWKHILVKELNSAADANNEISRMRAR
jgi:hypothetical protein